MNDPSGKPVARLNIVVQASSQIEADAKAEVEMKKHLQDAVLGKCHYTTTSKGLKYYCYLAY
jgi:hypothetical protein